MPALTRTPVGLPIATGAERKADADKRGKGKELDVRKKKLRTFIIRSCDSSDKEWFFSDMTADDIKLLKLDITTLPQALAKLSPRTNTTDSQPIVYTPDFLHHAVNVVGQHIHNTFSPDSFSGKFWNFYPTWAMNGYTYEKCSDTPFVMVSSHAREANATQILRSEMLACIKAEDIIRDIVIDEGLLKESHNLIRGRVISVTLEAIRVLDFTFHKGWMLNLEDEPRNDISITLHRPFDAIVAFETGRVDFNMDLLK